MWKSQKVRANRDILTIMQENRQIKKEIQLNCPTCRTIYQLLETQAGNNDQCADNCLKKWQQILQDYHSKELMVNLDQEDNE